VVQSHHILSPIRRIILFLLWVSDGIEAAKEASIAAIKEANIALIKPSDTPDISLTHPKCLSSNEVDESRLVQAIKDGWREYHPHL